MSSNVDKIKERLGVEEVISSYIKLESAGKNLKGKCPFHNEKTASFFVSPDRGSYYCFGCHAKGDIFSFVEQFEGIDFMGAMKLLAERAGIPLEFDRASQEHKSEKDRLFAIMEDATAFYEENLKHSQEAVDYVKNRGITEETAKNFRIGFAPADWRLLYTHLKNKKYSDQDIEKAGLAKKPEEAGKGYYDRFRGRIMFPIGDSSGRIIAFSGRILVDDGKSAKYLNSPDTPLYNKSTVLYGIDKAKHDIRVKNYSILVEGQMDLVLSHQAGVKNTVAVSGTALADTLMSKENTVNNLGVVRRLSSNIILAFDSDNAGRNAAMRSAMIALGLGMDVKIAAMPDGKDPADLIREDPELWKNALRNSKPVVEFQLDTVLSQKLDPRNVPKALRDNVFPFIAPLSGAMEKAHYIRIIKERTGLREEAIVDDLKKVEASARLLVKEQGQTIEKKEEMPTRVSRLDSITRKLFGLVYYLEKNQVPGIDADSLRATITTIAGDEYESIRKSFELIRDELLLESEIAHGLLGDKKDVIKKEIAELLLNFEEDGLRKKFSLLMAELTLSERNKDETRASELMQKCHAISKRLSELALTRRNAEEN